MPRMAVSPQPCWRGTDNSATGECRSLLPDWHGMCHGAHAAPVS